nr:putative reverse transcriptase domain-containing protein [Tanacetum cinerariifolium]
MPLKRSEGEELEYPFFRVTAHLLMNGEIMVWRVKQQIQFVLSRNFIYVSWNQSQMNDLMNNMRPRNRRRDEEDEESEENPFGDDSSSDEQSVLRPRRNQREDNRRWESGMGVNIPNFDGYTLNPEGFIDWLAAVKEVFEFKEVLEKKGFR